MDHAAMVRPATRRDASRLAQLKIEWAQLTEAPAQDERLQFEADLADWLDEDREGRICVVAEVGGELVGMGWLVIFERAPDIHDRRRLTADVQSLYVRPEHRGRGLGTALLQAACDEADAQGVRRVMVSANERVVGLYQRAGFAASPRLLERVDA